MSGQDAAVRVGCGHAPPGERRSPPRRWTWLALVRLPVVCAAVIGIVWSAAAFAFVWHWENARAQGKLTSTARNHFLAMQGGLDEYVAKLAALRALFETSNDLTRAQFKIFTDRLLRHEAGIQNFSWVRRVERGERAAVEQAAARDGIADYSIHGASAGSGMVSSPEHEEYYAILFSSVSQLSSPIYGIDLRADPALRRRLELARDTDGMAVIPDFVLHSVSGQVHAFLFSLPVYRTGLPSDTVEERRQNLLGFVHGAFFTSETFEHIISTATSPSGLDLYLFPADAGPATPPLHVHPSRLRETPLEDNAVRLSTITARPHYIDRLSAGDARWIFTAVPIAGGPLDLRHDRAWLVLAASILIGAIALWHISTSSRQTRRLLVANEQISELAQTDMLTGLMNRRAFAECLDTAFASCRRGAVPFAVLYFDLDHFKDVNDTLGHPIGDRLLQQVAERVKASVRVNDALARFGGDEFALLQADVRDAAPAMLARKINRMLAQPFLVDGNEVGISGSVGIAVYSAEIVTPDALMIQADRALYRAKEDGRGCFRFHDEEIDRRIHERVAIAAELRTAVERDTARSSIRWGS
jgi:diguanylate cyclase (GGDEF)-like protein